MCKNEHDAHKALKEHRFVADYGHRHIRYNRHSFSHKLKAFMARIRLFVER